MNSCGREGRCSSPIVGGGTGSEVLRWSDLLKAALRVSSECMREEEGVRELIPDASHASSSF